MAENEDPKDTGKANEAVVSLSQVLLAPLDALFKAQVHAARSFLSFVLQVGYGDQPKKRVQSPAAQMDKTVPSEPDLIYTVDFTHEVQGALNPDGSAGEKKLQKVSIPTLALVPLRPLAIESAEVELALEVTQVEEHRQIRSSARSDDWNAACPWFLVDHPISLRGHVAPTVPAASRTSNDDASKQRAEPPKVHVKVTVSSMPTPAALEKLLTVLTQSTNVEHGDPPQSPTQPKKS